MRKSEYQLIKEKKTWSQASEFCQNWGGDLVGINSATENEKVMNLLPKDSKEVLWIGFNERAQEGDWVNADGSTSEFTNWDKDEPNNWNGVDEDCAMINFMQKPQWHDAPCDEELWFVCERKVGPMPRMSLPRVAAKWDMSVSEEDSSDDDSSKNMNKRMMRLMKMHKLAHKLDGMRGSQRHQAMM